MPARRKFTDEQEREIASQYPEKSTHRLAKIYSTPAETISRIVSRQGGKVKSNSEASRKFTDEQEAEIASQYPAKNTCQLAEIYDTSAATISRIIGRQGGKVRSKAEGHRRFTDEQEAEIASRYPEKNTNELAKIYSTDAGVINRVIKRQGGEIRSNGEAQRRFTDEQEAEIAAQYPEMNASELAEIYSATAKTIANALERQGVDRCPADGHGDSVQHAINGTGHHQHQRECELYLFELARYSATHCKPGISFDTDNRADVSKGEYGEEVLRLFFATRAEAYFLEQAILDATRGSADYPADLAGWAGHSEVRAMPATDMVPTILRLAEELEELGQWEFAARYTPAAP
jgi:Mor family transcriptional regulator